MDRASLMDSDIPDDQRWVAT